jgi:DNA-binding protein HU-beta
MNKTELIAAVAAKTELTKKDTEATIAATLDVITEALAKDDKVALAGFGIFEVKTREARTGRNPRTGETMTIPASSVVTFKASSTLKG